MRALELSGFARCEDDALEEDHEKIAVYVDAEGRVHAARQLDALYWTSKLGRLHDIRLPLRALEEEYGAAVTFMRRPRVRAGER